MNHRLHVLGLVVLAAACGDSPGPAAAPSSVPPLPSSPAPMRTIAVTGTVYESTASGRRPLANVDIDISVEYQSWPPTVRTDANGRYRRPNVIPGPPLKLVAEKEGYSQPCRVPIQVTEADQDVYLVSNQTLSSTGIPAAMPIVEPTLSGLIFERTADGIQPIAGASIVLDFTGGMGWAPSATTVSDPAGRYLLCNVVDSTSLGLNALVSKPGFVTAYVPVLLRSNGTFDLELHRVP